MGSRYDAVFQSAENIIRNSMNKAPEVLRVLYSLWEEHFCFGCMMVPKKIRKRIKIIGKRVDFFRISLYDDYGINMN